MLHARLQARIGEIADRFSVSPSVLREAMTRLAQDGLLSASPQRGFSVPELTAGLLEDLTRARRIIEAAASRESIADGDLAWESLVLAAHHTLEKTRFTDEGGHITGGVGSRSQGVSCRHPRRWTE